MTTLDPSPHSPAAETDDTCVRCGYSLFRIADDQPCPECGLLAERSRRPSEQLRDSRPGYLRRLSWGVWLLIGAVVLAVIWAPMMEWATQLSRESRRFFRSHEEQLLLAGFEAAAVLTLIGVWFLTAREGTRPRSRLDRSLRGLAGVPLLCAGLAQFAIWLNANVPRGTYNASFEWIPSQPSFGLMVLQWLPWVILALLGVAAVVFPALLFRRLGDLGRRLLSRQLTEHCRIVGYGLSATALLAIGAMYLQANYRQLGISSLDFHRSNTVLLLMLAVVTAIALFMLWTLYLLVRFAIAFWSESRQLKRAWAAADLGGEN